MEIFFEEFEEYVKNKYGEESYLKKLMEDTLLPLKEALERITTDDIVESLFGKVDGPSILRDPIKKLAESISSYNLTPSRLNSGTVTPTSNTESGLDEAPKNVIVAGFNPEALASLYSVVGVAEKEKAKAKSNTNDSDEDSGGSSFSLIGMLLKGGLLVGGLAALMGGLFTDGKWKGVMKIASKSLLSLSGIEGGIKAFFGGITEGVSKFAAFFKESKIIKTLTKATGIDTLMKNMASGKGIYKFLGKSLKFLKKVPFLGSIISFAFAYDRFKTGDWVGGLMEIASGIASAFPVIGTAIAVGIDMIIALKDFATGGSAGASKMTAGEQGKAMLDKLPSFISENLKKFGEWFKTTALVKINEFIDTAKETLKGLPEKLGEGWANAIIGIGKFLKDKFDNFKTYLDENGGISVVAGKVLKAARDLVVDEIWPSIVDAAKGAWPIIKGYFSGLYKTLFVTIPSGFLSGVYSALDSEFNISDHITNFKANVREKWNALISKIKDGFLGFISKIKEWKIFGGGEDEKLVEPAGASYSGNLVRSRRSRKETKETIFARTEEQNAKNMSKQNAEIANQLKTTNTHVAKSEDIEQMTEHIVSAIQENSGISAQGSSVVANAVAGSGGSGPVNNITISYAQDGIKEIRRSGRSRARG